jgi:hypothetical protein
VRSMRRAIDRHKALRQPRQLRRRDRLT